MMTMSWLTMKVLITVIVEEERVGEEKESDDI